MPSLGGILHRSLPPEFGAAYIVRMLPRRGSCRKVWNRELECEAFEAVTALGEVVRSGGFGSQDATNSSDPASHSVYENEAHSSDYRRSHSPTWGTD